MSPRVGVASGEPTRDNVENLLLTSLAECRILFCFHTEIVLIFTRESRRLKIYLYLTPILVCSPSCANVPCMYDGTGSTGYRIKGIV